MTDRISRILWYLFNMICMHVRYSAVIIIMERKTVAHVPVLLANHRSIK
jgi:hypothetical protein